MSQDVLNNLLRNTEGIQIAAESPARRVPPSPLWERFIQPEIMLRFDMLGLRIPASLTAPQGWKNLPMEHVVRAQRLWLLAHLRCPSVA